MPNGYRIFRTADKFGTMQRKRGAKKKKASLPSLETTADFGAPSDSVTSTKSVSPSDALAVDSAPTAATATAQDTGADGAARRTRLDPTFLTRENRAFCEQQLQRRLSELSSVSATERKTKCVMTDDAPSAQSSPAMYTIVDLDAVNSLLEVDACRVCRGALTIGRDTHENGIAVKLKVCCTNCGKQRSQWSSRQVVGTATCNLLEINIPAARAMQRTGNGQTALNDVFSAMGVFQRSAQ